MAKQKNTDTDYYCKLLDTMEQINFIGKIDQKLLVLWNIKQELPESRW